MALRRPRSIPLMLFLGIVLGPAATAAGPPADPDEVSARAARLYDEGNYDEARPLLARLDDEGRATGPLLYRLAFCQRLAADPAANETLQRALSTLEQDLAGSTDLEVPFYLVNSYQTLRRSPDVTRVAAQTVARIESGELPEPIRTVDEFRLGKLYADLGQEGPASSWYLKALEGFESEGAIPAHPYRVWATRYLADRAMDRRDYAAAAERLAALDAQDAASLVELDRLATARARLGRWSEAQETWRKAERMDPANADRARYCGRLMALAQVTGELAEGDPSGRPWGQVSKEALEDWMKQIADRVRETKSEAQAPGLDEAARQALEKRITESRPIFVAAAIEYALNGYPIRETAFFGGYAPLIFFPEEWALPPPAETPAVDER